MEFSVAGHELEPVLLEATDKTGAIAELAEALGRHHGLARATVDAIREAALRREASLSTGMEKGVAVPHGILPEDSPDLLLQAGVLREPVEWGTIDGSRVRIVILFAVPEGRLRDYQRALGDVMGLLIDPEKRRALARRVDEGLST
jgi:PTS system fructose-specific IIC component